MTVKTATIVSIRNPKRIRGVTLIEIMLVIAIIAILQVIAWPAYQKYQDNINTTLAIADIEAIEQALERYWAIAGAYPESLDEINISLVDPWGNPYQYLNIATAKGNGKKRKDKNLVPINSDYDLYSAGADGKSVSPLTAKSSHDDIVRANNGTYLGRAEDY